MRISIHLAEKERPYLGPELRPHFLLTEMRIQGSALAAFIGPCEVKTDSMVDWEDRMVGDFIRSKLMLHFLGEFFGLSLHETVIAQRLFMAIAAQEIQKALNAAALGHGKDAGEWVERRGDDLFIRGRKASVSIVTASPVSTLLHAGINIDATGAPVEAIGLQDLGLDRDRVRKLSLAILEAFRDEMESIEWACAKVRPVI